MSLLFMPNAMKEIADTLNEPWNNYGTYYYGKQKEQNAESHHNEAGTN